MNEHNQPTSKSWTTVLVYLLLSAISIYLAFTIRVPASVIVSLPTVIETGNHCTTPVVKTNWDDMSKDSVTVDDIRCHVILDRTPTQLNTLSPVLPVCYIAPKLYYGVAVMVVLTRWKHLSKEGAVNDHSCSATVMSYHKELMDLAQWNTFMKTIVKLAIQLGLYHTTTTVVINPRCTLHSKSKPVMDVIYCEVSEEDFDNSYIAKVVDDWHKYYHYLVV